LSVCASTGAPDAATNISEEADRRRLRLKRAARIWFTEKVPDRVITYRVAVQKHCDPVR
jgi:hypothetical protein